MADKKKVKALKGEKVTKNYTPYRQSYQEAKAHLVQLHKEEFQGILLSLLNV